MQYKSKSGTMKKKRKQQSCGLHLDINTVWMIALSTLYTCYQLAFLTNTIAAAT